MTITPIAQRLADAVVRDVAELPDRTSSNEWPGMMLVSQDELHEIVMAKCTSLAQSGGEGEPRRFAWFNRELCALRFDTVNDMNAARNLPYLETAIYLAQPLRAPDTAPKGDITNEMVESALKAWFACDSETDSKIHASMRAALTAATTQHPDSHAFKNFHHMLCERFNYTHDEIDWRRDQVSLMEHIAKTFAERDTLLAGNARNAKDEVVGHKTFAVRGGYGGLGFRHEPLLRSEADAILRKCEDDKALRTELMPNEQAAINLFSQAWLRLKELGWKEAMYCPKDGTLFDAIEPGSTGIHPCYYQGEWPTGSWWMPDEDDEWPSHPVLFRPTHAAIDAAKEKGNA